MPESRLLRLPLALTLLLLTMWKVNSRSVDSSEVEKLLENMETSYRREIEELKGGSNPEFRGLPDLDTLLNPFDLDFDPDQEFDPEVTPGLFQGDIAYVPNEIAQFRVALNTEVFPTRKWDGNVVHYIISDKYTMKEKEFLKQAIDILNFMTCLEFRPWDGKAKDYLVIWPVKKPAGCWSFIGKLGGAQIVSLQQPDKKSKRCFISIGKPIHEIIHSLGFFHEQSRFDRNRYVYVIKKHIVPRFLNNFDMHARVNTTIEYEYDYTSVMHYGTHFFSVDRALPTMVPRRNETVIGQRNGMSIKDCLKVNSYYGCLDRSPFHRMKYNSICRLMGIRNNDNTFE